MLENVGLPDKFHIRPLNRPQIPIRIRGIPPNPRVLGAYATPVFKTLMPLFMLLF
jgi:hypothetical protein